MCDIEKDRADVTKKLLEKFGSGVWELDKLLLKQKRVFQDRLTYYTNLMDQFSEVETALRLLVERLESPASDGVTEQIKPLIVMREYGKVLSLKPGAAHMDHNWKMIVTHIAKESFNRD